MVASNSPEPEAEHLPSFGLWEKTCEHNLPQPASTALGLWFNRPGQSVSYFCVIFRDANGNGVDPDEEEWDHYTFHSRNGGGAFWDEEIEPPDYWAACRFLITGV